MLDKVSKDVLLCILIYLSAEEILRYKFLSFKKKLNPKKKKSIFHLNKKLSSYSKQAQAFWKKIHKSTFSPVARIEVITMLEKKFDLKVPNYEDLSLLEEREANLWRKSFLYHHKFNKSFKYFQDFIKVGDLDGLNKIIGQTRIEKNNFKNSDLVYFVNLFLF